MTDIPDKLTAGSLLTDDMDALNKAVASTLMEFEVKVRRWSDAITDKSIADEVAATRNITGHKVGMYKKHLLGDQRAEYEAMDSAYAAVRTRFYEVAMRLARNKYGVFTSEAPDAYKYVTDAIHRADELAEKFFDAYPARAAAAQAQLGGLTNSLEYPSVEDLRSRIGAEVSLNVMPDVATLDKMTLPKELAAVYAADVGNHQREIVGDMVTGMYDDLVQTTTELANYFGKKAAGEKGSKMFDSKITKIKRLARQLESAEGMVSTDFSGLSDAINNLASSDFEAAKASTTAAESVRDQATLIQKALTSLANKPDTPDNTQSPITSAFVEATGKTPEQIEQALDDAEESVDPFEAEIEAALAIEPPNQDVNPKPVETEEPEQEPEEQTPPPKADTPFSDLDDMFF